MSVGTWGPGTGATGTGSHPFCLRIQGVDYIGSVDLSSIVVNASVSSNATLTFTAWDATSALPIPQGWADVEFLDTTEQEWIFGGLVMGVEVSPWAAAGRRIDVRCVDYGVLLDVTPAMYPVATITAPCDPTYAFCLIAGAAPLGGVTALGWASGGHGRIIDTDRASNVFKVSLSAGALNMAAGSAVRSALDACVQREFELDGTTWLASGANYWVSPLKQLTVLPLASTLADAPLEIRQDPTTASHIAANSISFDEDGRQLAGGVYLSDSDTSDGDDSQFYVEQTPNGYTVIPISYSVGMSPGSDMSLTGQMQVANHQTTYSGQATVTTVKNFQPGQALTVYYPSIDLDGTYAITAVTTRFLGGGLKRQSTIQFNGERGTVARFNRTRFARAGVTT